MKKLDRLTIFFTIIIPVLFFITCDGQTKAEKSLGNKLNGTWANPFASITFDFDKNTYITYIGKERGEGKLKIVSQEANILVMEGTGKKSGRVVKNAIHYNGDTITIYKLEENGKKAGGEKGMIFTRLEAIQTPVPKQPSTTTQTQKKKPGYSRSFPADIGTTLSAVVEEISEEYKIQMTLLELVRGEDAWTRIKAANQFNDPPDPGFEYILAKIRFEYLEGSDPDVQYDLNWSSFTAVSSKGKDCDRRSVVEPDPVLEASLYPGASHEGWIALHVAKGDSAPLLTFGRDYRGRGGVWWKLYH